MPGLFDDVPDVKQSGSSNGLFDDVPNVVPASSGLFDDVPDAPPKTTTDEYGNRITFGKEIPDPRAGRSYFQNLKADLPTAGEFLGDVTRPVIKPLTDIGEGVRNVATDAVVNAAQSYGIIKPDTAEMNRVNGNPFSNIETGLTGDKTPAQKAIDLATEEARSRGELPVAGIAAGFGQGVLRDLPKFVALNAASTATAGLGKLTQLLTASGAAGGLFGYDENGDFSASRAAIMAALPGVSRIGETAAISALEKSGVELSSETAKEVVKRAGSAVTQQAFFNATSLPEYAQATPDQRWEIFANNLSNLGFEVPGVVGLFKTAKAERDFKKSFAEEVAAANPATTSEPATTEDIATPIQQASGNRFRAPVLPPRSQESYDAMVENANRLATIAPAKAEAPPIQSQSVVAEATPQPAIAGAEARPAGLTALTPEEVATFKELEKEGQLSERGKAKLAQWRTENEGKFVSGGPLEKVGGMSATFGGDTIVHVIASPDNPAVGFVTGLRGKGLASKAAEIESALRIAGFKAIEYRPDNEDGRAAARVRLFEAVKKKFSKEVIPNAQEKVQEENVLTLSKEVISKDTGAVAPAGVEPQKVAAAPVVPDDFTRYGQIKQEQRALIKSGKADSPEMTALFGEAQEIRNRNGDAEPINPADPDYATKKAAMDAYIASKAGKNATKEAKPVVATAPRTAEDARRDYLTINFDTRTGGLADSFIPEAAKRRQFNLSELTAGKPVFHETSLDNAYRLVAELKKQAKRSWTSFFVSDNPDLALGQAGKGVLFEIDPARINGWRHEKPGTTDTTGYEYWVDKSVAGGLNAVTFKTKRQLDAFQKHYPKTFDYEAVTKTDRGLRLPVKGKETNEKTTTIPTGVLPESSKTQTDVVVAAKKTQAPASKAAGRALDTSGRAAFGSAFNANIPERPAGLAKLKQWWTDNITRGEGSGKTGESKTTLVLRDTGTGALHEVSTWNNKGEKIIDPVTGKSTGAFNTETKKGLLQGAKYVPVVALRHAEPLSKVNRPITVEELAALQQDYESKVTGLEEVSPEGVGAQHEGELVDQPGVTVVAKSDLGRKAKPTPRPDTTKADAEGLFDAIGLPQWEDKADARDVIISALETSNSKQVAGYLKQILDWVRANDLDTAEELSKFADKVYESFEKPKQQVIDGKLAPAEYRAAVIDSIAKAAARDVQPRGKTKGKTESAGLEAGADVPSGDAIDNFLTNAIESVTRKPGQVLEGVTGAPIWIAQDAARVTLIAVRGPYRIGKDIVKAIDAGIDRLRALPNFNEQEARAWLEKETAPDITQVSGNEVGILSKTVAPSLEEQIAYSAKTLSDYGLPVERVDKADARVRGNPVKTQFRFKPDGVNHDANALRLADDLEAEIAKGDQANNLRISNLTTSIANSIANGDASVLGSDGRPMISDAVQQRLFNLAQTPASEAGQLLATRGQHSFDPEGELQMARNVGVNLRNIWGKTLGGDQITAVMDKITEVFRGYFNPEIVQSVLAPLKLDPRIVASVSELLTQPRPDITRIQDDISQRLQREFAFSEQQAEATAKEIFKALEKTFATATEGALKAVQDGLVGEQKRIFKRGGSLWEALRKAVKSGMFDPGVALEKIAKDLGYTIPTPEQKAQIKSWVEREEFLRTPSQQQIVDAGGDVVKATKKAEIATETERLDLIRKIQANWGRWSKPVKFLKWLSDNPEIARNNAQAVNEFVAANLLATSTFLTRQSIDVGLVTMPLNAANRTLAHVLERASNDGGFNVETLADLGTATKEMVTARIESLRTTARQAGSTLRGEASRKVLERTTHNIAIFERMRVMADELEAKGNKAAATAIRVSTILRAGYRVAETWDSIQATGLEWQEMKQQLSTELRKMGKTRAEIGSQADDIFNLSRLDVEQAKAEAALIGTERGLTKSNRQLALDADNLLKARTYDRMSEATNGKLDFRAENEVLRELHAWNLPETGGIGGVIAETIKGIKSKTEAKGIPTGGLFSFGNAMGIAANRMATFSGGGLFGGWGFGDSPWYHGERNIQQRRIESIQGLSAIGLFTALAAAGKILIQTKYPKDKDEKEKFLADGHKLNTIRFMNDDGGWLEVPISMTPFSYIASPLYMIGGVQQLFTEQKREQAKLDAEALRTGAVAGKANPIGLGDLMGVLAQGAYGMFTGGRTASGAIQTFSDYGDFKLNKAVAGLASPYIPGLPAWNGVARMMGAAVDTRTATLMELLVPSPWSPHQRVNSLGDSLANPNSGVRILQVLSGGVGFGNESDLASNHAYRQLFTAGYATPDIAPNKGYNFNGTIRPMQGGELDRYAVARAKAFKQELDSVNVDGLPEDQAHRLVAQAFNRANSQALAEVGVTQNTASSDAGSSVQASQTKPAGTGFAGGVSAGFGAGGIGGRSSGLGGRSRGAASRLGLGGGRGGIRVSAGSLAPRSISRLTTVHLPSVKAPSTTRVFKAPTRTRRASRGTRNRLRR